MEDSMTNVVMVVDEADKEHVSEDKGGNVIKCRHCAVDNQEMIFRADL